MTTRARVVALLRDPELCRWSNATLAQLAGCAAPYVGRLRRQVPGAQTPWRRFYARWGRLSDMDTTRIGARRSVP